MLENRSANICWSKEINENGGKDRAQPSTNDMSAGNQNKPTNRHSRVTPPLEQLYMNHTLLSGRMMADRIWERNVSRRRHTARARSTYSINDVISLSFLSSVPRQNYIFGNFVRLVHFFNRVQIAFHTGLLADLHSNNLWHSVTSASDLRIENSTSPRRE